MNRSPIIGISCCLRSIAFGDYPPTPHHTVFHKYVDYVTSVLKAIPVLLPSTPFPEVDDNDYRTLVDRLDGVLLTGSPSNVGIRRSDHGFNRIVPKGTPDYARDLTTSRLILNCVALGVPLLGICRGMQEINVAFGGDLHEELWAVASYNDHRSDKSLPYDQRYQPRHSVRVAANSQLQDLLRAAGISQSDFRVNSLHGQGISEIGNGITVEAIADDGVIEVIGITGARSFAMGVQWHIEWSGAEQPLDQCIGAAFKAACEARLTRHAN